MMPKFPDFVQITIKLLKILEFFTKNGPKLTNISRAQRAPKKS